jgi:cell division septation protein DedD
VDIEDVLKESHTDESESIPEQAKVASNSTVNNASKSFDYAAASSQLYNSKASEKSKKKPHGGEKSGAKGKKVRKQKGKFAIFSKK